MQDRRLGKRRSIALEVILKQDGVASLHARTRDLGLDGAFVLAGGDTADVGVSVELDLPLPYHGRTAWHRFVGEVVRRTPQGIGLRFASFDNHAYTALVDAVYGGRRTHSDSLN